MKKTKLVWAIILFAIGIIGILGIGQIESNQVMYIITCFIIAGIGVLLFILYKKDKKIYEARLAELREQQIRKEQLNKSRQELEQAKIDAELQRLKTDKNSTKVCPACGATSNGDICEYCGRKL